MNLKTQDRPPAGRRRWGGSRRDPGRAALVQRSSASANKGLSARARDKQRAASALRGHTAMARAERGLCRVPLVILHRRRDLDSSALSARVGRSCRRLVRRNAARGKLYRVFGVNTERGLRICLLLYLYSCSGFYTVRDQLYGSICAYSCSLTGPVCSLQDQTGQDHCFDCPVRGAFSPIGSTSATQCSKKSGGGLTQCKISGNKCRTCFQRAELHLQQGADHTCTPA